VGGQGHAPTKTWYPLYSYMRLGRIPIFIVHLWLVFLALGPVWTCAKNRSPPGFDPWTVQPVASRYTEYATPAHPASLYYEEYVYVYTHILLRTDYIRITFAIK
jgi:hypothetical protein